MSSTAARRPEGTVFYLDESIYSKLLLAAMQAAGARVRGPSDAAGFGAADDIWLRFCARHRWIVLMRDQRVRFRILELSALAETGVGAFVFTGGQASAADTATVVCRLLRKLANMAKSERRPFLYTFGSGGTLSRVRLRR